ncbi:MAG TPA: ABC transporter ATP-binding protein, partial [Polyangiaceae bacterium]
MTPKTRKRAPLLRAVLYLRPHAGELTSILALTLVGASCAAVEPLVLKWMIDELGSANSARSLLLGVAALLGVALMREQLAALSNWLTWRTRLRIHSELLDGTVERLHTLPVGFHRAHGVGALMTRLDRGIQGFLGGLGELAFNVLPAFVYLAIAAGIMIDLEARLAVIALLFTPVPAILAARAGPEQARHERQLLERWAKIYGRFNEVLSGILTVRSFAMEDDEKRRFLTQVNEANGV